MKVCYSKLHQLQNGNSELTDGQLVPCHENPTRAKTIFNHLKKESFIEIIEAKDFGLTPIERVHELDYIEFLKTAWGHWKEIHGEIDALPLIWPVRSLRQTKPKHIDGLLSYYSMDAGTPITAGTWEAITAAVNVTLTAQNQIINGEQSAFALCRPPGHHASKDVYGGYCFLNNAAIAAQKCLDDGMKKVVVLDIDYHHGNGTQDIFYDRNDVMFLSIHADPIWEFPYFLGHKDEIGKGQGEGFNFNFPLPFGTSFAEWQKSLNQAMDKIISYKPDCIIVSLGVDTFEDDPISEFKLKSNDYLTIGHQLSKLQLPTLFVMEGGYDLDSIGQNVLNVLKGFESIKV